MSAMQAREELFPLSKVSAAGLSLGSCSTRPSKMRMMEGVIRSYQELGKQLSVLEQPTTYPLAVMLPRPQNIEKRLSPYLCVCLSLFCVIALFTRSFIIPIEWVKRISSLPSRSHPSLPYVVPGTMILFRLCRRPKHQLRSLYEPLA